MFNQPVETARPGPVGVRADVGIELDDEFTGFDIEDVDTDVENEIRNLVDRPDNGKFAVDALRQTGNAAARRQIGGFCLRRNRAHVADLLVALGGKPASKPPGEKTKALLFGAVGALDLALKTHVEEFKFEHRDAFLRTCQRGAGRMEICRCEQERGSEW